MTVSTFYTRDGVEVPAITAEHMREIDRVATEELGPNLYQMMENAGRNLAELAIELVAGSGAHTTSDWTAIPIVVLAGTGGNGGGGICAARHLANHGANVTLVLTNITRLREVPEKQLELYRAADGRLGERSELADSPAGLVIDAVLGYSLTSTPTGEAADLIQWMAQQCAPILSLDVPSGVNATTGIAPGAHVTASTTMTLALPKTGLDSDAVGDLWLADIGIPKQTYERAGAMPPKGIFSSGYRVRLLSHDA